MRLIASLTLALLSVFLALPVAARTTDNIGRPLPEPEHTAGVFGAASADTTPAATTTWTPSLFDLAVSFGAVGDNDTTGANELAVASVSLNWLPKPYVKIGGSVAWSPSGTTRLDFGLPLTFYVWPRYDTNAKPFILLDLVTYSVWTDGQKPPDTGSWSFNPAVLAGVEFPQDGYSLAFNVGFQYLFTDLGETVNDFGGWGAAAKVNFWLGR